MDYGMNAVEIIEEISRMPEAEREKVVAYLNQKPTPETCEAMEEARHPEKLEAFANADELFAANGIKC